MTEATKLYGHTEENCHFFYNFVSNIRAVVCMWKKSEHPKKWDFE